jgi:hypothetical protein
MPRDLLTAVALDLPRADDGALGAFELVAFGGGVR